MLNPTENGLNEKLFHDLDQSCLKTIVSLLHQLPLQPFEPVQEGQLAQVKSRIFYKYFTFFMKLLNRCKNIEVGIIFFSCADKNALTYKTYRRPGLLSIQNPLMASKATE
jgi:hypothetical protein